MPEFVEAEAYRRTIEPLLGQRVDQVEIRDERLLRHGDMSRAAVESLLSGATISGLRRRGKAVLVDLDADATVALAFGLRGWLSLDARVALANGEGWRDRAPRPDHIRLRIESDGHLLELEDQLRLSTLRVDVDEFDFGVDVLELDAATLRDLCSGSSRSIKTLLMDQDRIAGIGNLVADEMLYQARLDPRRAADELDADELHELWVGVRRTRSRVMAANGSHHGVMIDSGARERGARCPRCDVAMERVSVGGRTTFFCPQHQT